MARAKKINYYRNRFDKALQTGRPGATHITYTARKWKHKKEVDFKQREFKAPPGQLKRIAKELIRSKTIFGKGNKIAKEVNFRIEFHHKDIGSIKHLLTKNLALAGQKAEVFSNLGGKLHVSPGGVQHISVKELKGGRLLTSIIIKEKGQKDKTHVFESIVRKPIVTRKEPVLQRIAGKIAGIKNAFTEALTTYKEQRASGSYGLRGALEAARHARDLTIAKSDAKLSEKNYRYEIDTNSLAMIVNDQTTYEKDPTRWRELSRRVNLTKKFRNAGMTDEAIYLHHKHAGR